MRATRLLPLTLLFTSTPALGAASYPIDPVSLLGLCSEATLIVVADVEHCVEHTAHASFWSSCARLAPREFLKGEVTREPLHVRHAAGLICPAPASYLDGERVLAFLRWDAEDQAFFTCSLSYGTKYPDDEGLAVYRERIAEVARILAIEDDDSRLEQTVEWLVTCAEHPATLGEALIELTRYRSSRSTEPHHADSLTAPQCERLARAIASTPPVEGQLPHSLVRLMSVVADRLDGDDLRALVEQFQRTLRLPAPPIPAQRLILEAFAAAVADRVD
jgi:hypothetical protein